MALVGHVDQISRMRVEGWVIDTDRQDETVSVSAFVNGSHRGTCLTTHARADAKLPNGETITGKCAFYMAFDPPLSPFIELRIEVKETWTAELLRNGLRVLPRPSSHGGPDAGMVPILLTSTGRTGTTLLMSEFARHPNVVVGDHSPYEIKQIAYHAAAFRALAGDGDRERSTVPETMLSGTMRHIIGSNPYNIPGYFGLGSAKEPLRNFWQTQMPSGFATLFRSLILEFYATLANAQGKRLAPYFCEKGDIDDAAVQGARLFFDTVKDVVIVRDPRDLLCSAIAFWKLRPDAAMAMLATTIPRLTRIGRHGGPNTILIRYEDLVRDPAISRRALSDFLGVDLLNPALAQPKAIPDSHRTSLDPAASIGRWRNDLTIEQADACEILFGLYMSKFGYETNGHTRPAGPVREGAGNSIVAAEGALAVTAFEQNTFAETADGTPSRRMLELVFGREGNSASFTMEGWSSQERGFLWSCSDESTVRLPAIREAGDYRLYITAAPFTHGTVLDGQRVVVFLDGSEVGTARAGHICVISIEVPNAVSGSGQAITLTLRFPDAARPSDIAGSEDDRRLGFSLYRLVLFRIEADRKAMYQEPTQPVRRSRRRAVDDPVTPASPSGRTPKSRRAHIPATNLTNS